MLNEVSLRYRLHKSAAGHDLTHDLTKLFDAVSKYMALHLTEIYQPNLEVTHDQHCPLSPFQVLNVSNISMDISTRISLTPTSLMSEKCLKRKLSDVENGKVDRIAWISYGFSLVKLLLTIVSEYKAVGGEVSEQILTQWTASIEPIYSIGTNDDIPWSEIAKNIIPPTINSMFPSFDIPVE